MVSILLVGIYGYTRYQSRRNERIELAQEFLYAQHPGIDEVIRINEINDRHELNLLYGDERRCTPFLGHF